MRDWFRKPLPARRSPEDRAGFSAFLDTRSTFPPSRSANSSSNSRNLKKPIGLRNSTNTSISLWGPCSPRNAERKRPIAFTLYLVSSSGLSPRSTSRIWSFVFMASPPDQRLDPCPIQALRTHHLVVVEPGQAGPSEPVSESRSVAGQQGFRLISRLRSHFPRSERTVSVPEGWGLVSYSNGLNITAGGVETRAFLRWEMGADPQVDPAPCRIVAR